MIEGTDVMALILFNIRFLYTPVLNQSFDVHLANIHCFPVKLCGSNNTLLIKSVVSRIVPSFIAVYFTAFGCIVGSKKYTIIYSKFILHVCVFTYLIVCL